jgi:hypothetical protein
VAKVKNLPRNTKNRELIGELWDRVVKLEMQVKTLNEQAIKNGDLVEYETTEIAGETTTPRALAAELGVSDKRVRDHLRDVHSRDINLKARPWKISPAIAAEVRDFFSNQ